MRVFVAGATGVLGTAAVRGLVAGGHKVTGIARSQAKRDALTALGASPAAADLFDPASLRRAIAGHDVVVNLASKFPEPKAAVRTKGWAENDRIQREASRNIAEAAAAEGVSRLVQGADSFCYEDGGDGWITERQSVRGTYFSASSLEATEHAMNFADAYRFAVVLRFGLVYGDDPMTRRQFERVRAGKPVVMGDPAGYLSPIAVDDAGAAVFAAVSSPSGIYNVSGSPLTRGEWAAQLGAAAGAEGGADFYPPLMTRVVSRRVEPLLRSHRISSDAFHNATGWRAKVMVNEGLVAAAR